MIIKKVKVLYIAPIKITPIPHMDIYEVCEPVRYLLHINGKPHTWTVPEGFQTDGASIPRLFWCAVGHPFSPKMQDAAVLHDYMYYTRLPLVSRKLADDIFYRLLQYHDCPNAFKMYMAVRVAGGAFWK